MHPDLFVDFISCAHKTIFSTRFCTVIFYLYGVFLHLSVIACVALAFLLTPLCQYVCGSSSNSAKVSCGCCGRYSAAELAAFGLSLAIVTVWILTGHWLLMDGEFYLLNKNQILFTTLLAALVECYAMNTCQVLLIKHEIDGFYANFIPPYPQV